eukprot:Nk52_evm1s551 gene=Nk52_evmTU1s551
MAESAGKRTRSEQLTKEEPEEEPAISGSPAAGEMNLESMLKVQSEAMRKERAVEMEQLAQRVERILEGDRAEKRSWGSKLMEEIKREAGKEVKKTTAMLVEDNLNINLRLEELKSQLTLTKVSIETAMENLESRNEDEATGKGSETERKETGSGNNLQESAKAKHSGPSERGRDDEDWEEELSDDLYNSRRYAYGNRSRPDRRSKDQKQLDFLQDILDQGIKYVERNPSSYDYDRLLDRVREEIFSKSTGVAPAKAQT